MINIYLILKIKFSVTELTENSKESYRYDKPKLHNPFRIPTEPKYGPVVLQLGLSYYVFI